MSYEISSLIRKKLSEIENIFGEDYGEWENTEEEKLCESISNICIELQNLIDRLPEVVVRTK